VLHIPEVRYLDIGPLSRPYPLLVPEHAVSHEYGSEVEGSRELDIVGARPIAAN